MNLFGKKKKTGDGGARKGKKATSKSPPPKTVSKTSKMGAKNTAPSNKVELDLDEPFELDGLPPGLMDDDSAATTGSTTAGKGDTGSGDTKHLPPPEPEKISVHKDKMVVKVYVRTDEKTGRVNVTLIGRSRTKICLLVVLLCRDLLAAQRLMAVKGQKGVYLVQFWARTGLAPQEKSAIVVFSDKGKAGFQVRVFHEIENVVQLLLELLAKKKGRSGTELKPTLQLYTGKGLLLPEPALEHSTTTCSLAVKDGGNVKVSCESASRLLALCTELFGVADIADGVGSGQLESLAEFTGNIEVQEFGNPTRGAFDFAFRSGDPKLNAAVAALFNAVVKFNEKDKDVYVARTSGFPVVWNVVTDPTKGTVTLSGKPTEVLGAGWKADDVSMTLTRSDLQGVKATGTVTVCGRELSIETEGCSIDEPLFTLAVILTECLPGTLDKVAREADGPWRAKTPKFPLMAGDAVEEQDPKPSPDKGGSGSGSGTGDSGGTKFGVKAVVPDALTKAIVVVDGGNGHIFGLSQTDAANKPAAVLAAVAARLLRAPGKPVKDGNVFRIDGPLACDYKGSVSFSFVMESEDDCSVPGITAEMKPGVEAVVGLLMDPEDIDRGEDSIQLEGEPAKPKEYQGSLKPLYESSGSGGASSGTGTGDKQDSPTANPDAVTLKFADGRTKVEITASLGSACKAEGAELCDGLLGDPKDHDTHFTLTGPLKSRWNVGAVEQASRTIRPAETHVNLFVTGSKDKAFVTISGLKRDEVERQLDVAGTGKKLVRVFGDSPALFVASADANEESTSVKAWRKKHDKNASDNKPPVDDSGDPMTIVDLGDGTAKVTCPVPKRDRPMAEKLLFEPGSVTVNDGQVPLVITGSLLAKWCMKNAQQQVTVDSVVVGWSDSHGILVTGADEAKVRGKAKDNVMGRPSVFLFDKEWRATGPKHPSAPDVKRLPTTPRGGAIALKSDAGEDKK